MDGELFFICVMIFGLSGLVLIAACVVISSIIDEMDAFDL